MVAKLTPVRLKYWGLTRWDADRARQDATVEAGERDWEIVESERSTGSPNPLRPRDYSALHYTARFNRAWAFYNADEPSPAAEATEESGDEQ